MTVTIPKAERAKAQGKKATMLGKDIVSAFNRVSAGRLIDILGEKELHQLAITAKSS